MVDYQVCKDRIYFFVALSWNSLWGASFSFVKIGVENGSPFVFLAYKFTLAVVVIAIIFGQRLSQLSWRAVISGTLIGLSLLCGTLFQTIGFQYTSVTNTAFITGLDVLLIPIFKWGLFRKPVQGRIWISCTIALVGLFLIVAQYGLRLNLGDLWIMTCAIFFASYVITVGHFAHRYDSILTVLIAMVVCSLGCGFLALLDGQAIWIPADSEFWEGALFSGLLGTAYIYCVQSTAQKYIEEEKVALTYLCEPIFAAIAGMILLGEAISIKTIIGGTLILVALLFSEIDMIKLAERWAW